MSEVSDSPTARAIRIIDEDKNCYRDYHFIEDSDDIQNQILQHIIYFGQNTEFHDHKDILKAFTSLCHKVNIVKYHLKRYREIEDSLELELSDSENFIDHDGSVLVERIELTAEYESFLIQFKATLDILVKFLNIIYRNDQSCPMRNQQTFKKKGQGVIEAIEKYLKHNRDDKSKLTELLNYLKSACSEESSEKPETVNWIISMINRRDTVAHYRKADYFAFQINYMGGLKEVIRPNFTHGQTVKKSFEIAYNNLLTFIQDFIALLFLPYLDERLQAFTYRREDVIEGAPRWYLQVSPAFPPHSIWQNIGNLSKIKSFCEKDPNPGRLTSDYVEKMYLYYASFYKEKGTVLTSKGVEVHSSDEPPKLVLEFKD